MVVSSKQKLVDYAKFAYDTYLKHEYTNQSNKAAWVYPTNSDIARDPSLRNKPKVFRPNHGLAHSLRVTANVEPVINYLQKFGKDSSIYNFTEKQKRQLEIAALFSVTGRDNDTGWAGNPELYKKMRLQSGDNFESFCREHHIFDNETELQEYKKHLIDMGEPSNHNPIHVVINMAHKLDLLRCFSVKDEHSQEAIVDYINSYSKFKNNRHMIDLVQYAVNTNQVTGNRVWSYFKKNKDGDYILDKHGNANLTETPKDLWGYKHDTFYKCSTDPEYCIEQINKIEKPKFEKKSIGDKSTVSAFESIAHDLKETNLAIRLVNNSANFQHDLHYEFDEWVDPQNKRWLRDWWKDSTKIGDKTLYKDQITGKLIKRPVMEYIPIEKQKHVNENPPLSEYWTVAEDGQYVPKPRPIIVNSMNMGAPRNTVFTKKRSFSLVRPDGKLKHFNGPARTKSSFLPIGVGCDVNLLHQKGQRYIWRGDTRSSEKFWTGNQSLNKENENHPKYPDRNKGLWLHEMQDELKSQAKNNMPADWYNEMLMGAQPKALKMLFAKENNRTHRLNLLYGAARLKNEYGFDLPLCILDGKSPVGIYTKEQIYHDLQSISKSKNSCALDHELYDRLVKSHFNHYRWNNELTSYIDLNSNDIKKLLKSTKYQNIGLDDASRKAAGKSILSDDFKVAELAKSHKINTLINQPYKRLKLTNELYHRLDVPNQKLTAKQSHMISGLKPAIIPEVPINFEAPVKKSRHNKTTLKPTKKEEKATNRSKKKPRRYNYFKLFVKYIINKIKNPLFSKKGKNDFEEVDLDRKQNILLFSQKTGVNCKKKSIQKIGKEKNLGPIAEQKVKIKI